MVFQMDRTAGMRKRTAHPAREARTRGWAVRFITQETWLSTRLPSTAIKRSAAMVGWVRTVLPAALAGGGWVARYSIREALIFNAVHSSRIARTVARLAD